MHQGSPVSANKQKHRRSHPQKISKLGQYAGYSFPKYKRFSIDSMYITMRDGVNLAADLYLPIGSDPREKIPTILYLTRYVRSFEAKFPFNILTKSVFGQIKRKEIQFFTSYGYAVVVVDVRGTGASFGTRSMEFSPEEIADGKEIVDWIIDHPWSNGKVGTTGISYLGTTAEMLLVNQHPAVKACIPRSSIFDLYNDIVFPGGVRHGKFIRVWRDTTHALDKNKLKYIGLLANTLIRNPKPVKEDVARTAYASAKREHQHNFDIFEGMFKITYRDQPHPDLQRSINEFSVHHYKDKIEASGTPIYRIGGWYDGALANSAIRGFLSTSNSVKLTIGPWDHGPAQNISPFTRGKRQKFNIHLEMLRFFDHHLKGIENGILQEAPIAYYAMGKEEWRSVEHWPLEDSQLQRFMLSADQSLVEEEGSRKEGELTHVIDEGFGTGGGSRWNSLTVKYRYKNRIGYFDWKRRSGPLLQFTSSPLESDMELTGHAIAEIYLSSDAKDVQLFVYVDCVDAQGKVTYITEGQFRGIHRKISPEAAPYPVFGPYHTFCAEDALEWIPGKVELLHFELIPTSHLIPKGSRIRVSVSGADADHFDRIDEGEHNPTRLNIACSSAFPSALHLPLKKV